MSKIENYEIPDELIEDAAEALRVLWVSRDIATVNSTYGLIMAKTRELEMMLRGLLATAKPTDAETQIITAWKEGRIRPVIPVA